EVMLKQLKNCNLTDITIAVGHLGNLIQTYFGHGKKFGVNIDYSFEEKPLGTVGPLTRIPGLNETFLTMNGDLLTTLDYMKLIDYHKKQKPIATVAAQKRSVDVDFGIIQRNQDDHMVKYIEKPTLSYTVSMGIYIFEPEIFEFIPKNTKLDFPDLMQVLLEKEKKVAIYNSNDFWLDIGRPDDYQRAIEEFEKNKERFINKE
ncbi:MAG: nucleoside-diphosphate-sugar pyrophosphorylase, partial [candidate division Zixibacteria bacterium SM1_73]